MAALLYLGAGIGMSLLSVVDKTNMQEKLDRHDLPYTVGMILLDIAAPIFLMLGISYGTSANASLLGNFEIVATIHSYRTLINNTIVDIISLPFIIQI